MAKKTKESAVEKEAVVAENQLKKANESLRADNTAMLDEIRDLKLSVKSYKSANTHLRNELANQKNLTEEKGQEVAKSAATIELMQVEADVREKRISGLESQVLKLAGKLKDSANKIEEYKTELGVIKANVGYYNDQSFLYRIFHRVGI